MRHRKAKRKLNRSPAHRRATINNMLLGLIEHGRIKTTERRAKELRRIAERMISKATRLGDILTKDKDTLNADEKAKLIHAMRIVGKSIQHRESVMKLFTEWGPRFLERPGGYTRIYKTTNRRGDNAPMALIEFVDRPEETTSADSDEKDGKKGVFSRFRKEDE